MAVTVKSPRLISNLLCLPAPSAAPDRPGMSGRSALRDPQSHRASWLRPTAPDRASPRREGVARARRLECSVPVFTDVFATSAVAAYPMYGFSAVAAAVLRSSSSRARSASAAMPSTHRRRSADMALRRIVEACRAFHAMTGIITFSSSCPASQASAIVWSQPITWKQTWFTISGIDGFTLPGMMDEPGCTAGSASSESPARGPMLSRRRSLAILLELDGQSPHRAGIGEHIAHALRDAEQVLGGLQRQARCNAAGKPSTAAR